MQKNKPIDDLKDKTKRELRAIIACKLHFDLGLSQRIIADLLGCTQSGISRMIKRAPAILKPL